MLHRWRDARNWALYPCGQELTLPLRARGDGALPPSSFAVACTCPLVTQSGHLLALPVCWFESLRYCSRSQGANHEAARQRANSQDPAATGNQTQSSHRAERDCLYREGPLSFIATARRAAPDIGDHT